MITKIEPASKPWTVILYEMYQKAKKPLIFFLLAFALIVPYIPQEFFGKDFSLTAVWAGLGTILLEILFTMQNKIVEFVDKNDEKIEQYDSWSDASTKVMDIIKRQLKNEKEVKISAIGLALRTYEQLVREVINTTNNQPKIKLQINLLMIDVDYLASENTDLPKSLIDQYSTQAEGTEATLRFLKERYKSRIDEGRLEINLFKYNYLPNLYGVLIDEEYLFLGHTYWEKKSLRGAGSTYEFFENDDDFGGYQKIQLFNSWFNFAKAKYEDKTIAPSPSSSRNQENQ